MWDNEVGNENLATAMATTGSMRVIATTRYTVHSYAAGKNESI